MNRKTLIMALAVALFGLCLVCAGCSDGGSSSGTPGPGGTSGLTGTFVDSPVAGLWYQTATESGYTDSAGTFSYQNGETVSFYIGDILLGSAEGKSMITPFDLVGMDIPQTSSDFARIRNLYKNSGTPTPMEAVINIAVLLQSMDEDGDHSNGIRIPDGIDALTAGLDLEFYQDPGDFSSDYQLMELMKRGRTDGIWGGARAILDSAYALDALYEGLGIEAELLTPSAYYYSTDGDPASWQKKDTAVYDSLGNREQLFGDEGLDGAETVRTTEFDYNGYLVYREIAESEMITNPRGANRPDIEREVSTIETFKYDENGFVKESVVSGKISLLYFVNPEITELNDVIKYVRDANGNLVSAARYEISVDARGVRHETLLSQQTGTYVYNSIGVPTSAIIETDEGGDDTVDLTETYTRDDNGTLLSYVYDDANNDAADYTETYTYDDNGVLSAFAHDYQSDGAYDNPADYTETYTYDDNGNMILLEYDGNPTQGPWGPGPDPDYTKTYTYDENGYLAQMHYDGVQAGPFAANPDYTETYQYDANGFLLYFAYDGNAGWGQPDPDYADTYTYDSLFNITSITHDAAVDANDSFEVRTYENGLLETVSTDIGMDGTFEDVTTTVYVKANGFRSLEYLD